MGQHHSSGEHTAKLRASSGYEYEIDFKNMSQTNLSTHKVRMIRRREASFRRIVVNGGDRFCVNVDLAMGETVDWLFEVDGDHKIDFSVVFINASDEDKSVEILNVTRSACAWNFAAPAKGRVQLSWKSFFKMASPRVILLDWYVTTADV